MSDHRCGVVALLGRPNAGKSTLFNALLGEKLAITAGCPQSTRGALLGVLTYPGAQVLLYDTPGINRGQTRFNLAMTDAALARAREADVRVLLLDARAEWDLPEARVAELPPPILLVRTKLDTGPPTLLPRGRAFAGVHEVSAQTAKGIPELSEAIVSLLPESPALYPEDTLTDAPLRFLAAETVREVACELYRDEIPYALAVEVEAYREDDHEVLVRANVLVERASQKPIVVGTGGRMLKELGSEARRRLRGVCGKPVHLELWVKTDRNWRKRPKRARELGYL